MESCKVKVRNEAESKEAQELFFKLNLEKSNWSNFSLPKFIAARIAENNFSDYVLGDVGMYKYKEITIPELRAMVNHEQDEPFLTPECTLNDQYAEIEQVRQVEIHGTVKAEPDLNFGAAQASGGAKEKCSTPSPAWDVQIGGIHYKQFKIQPMQFALENKLDAAQQNVIKYIMRHSFKNGKQDLEKAKHYIDLMIEFYYGENDNG